MICVAVCDTWCDVLCGVYIVCHSARCTVFSVVYSVAHCVVCVAVGDIWCDVLCNVLYLLLVYCVVCYIYHGVNCMV